MTQHTKKQTSQENNPSIRPKNKNPSLYNKDTNLSLTMYAFSISLDERVPLKFPVTNRLK